MVVKAIKDSSNSIVLCVIKPPSMEELELQDKTGARTPWIEKTDMVLLKELISDAAAVSIQAFLAAIE